MTGKRSELARAFMKVGAKLAGVNLSDCPPDWRERIFAALETDEGRAAMARIKEGMI
jgi:hypothetical protein